MENHGRLPKEAELLMAIIDTAPMGIVALEMDGTIRIINRMASQTLGIKQEVDRTWGTHICSYLDKTNLLYEKLKTSLQQGGKDFNLKGIKYNHHYLTITGKKLMESYILTINNMTELKEMESQSIRSMIKGQETERKRLSKEIHDGLAPLLSTIKISLEALHMETEKDPGNQHFDKKIRGIHELIGTLAEDMRHISHALMPKVLEDFGVGPALESLCNRLNDNEKIAIHYYAGFDDRLEKSVELNLYRVAQELVNNSLKHSGAAQINIQLIRHSHSVMLMVEDNGVGFDKQEVMHSTRGIGLRNIETRTKMTGGTFYLDTSPGKGVTATLEIPLEHA